MKVVTTFHAPSSVVSSVKCRLGSRDIEHLAVAKHSRVDVYSLQPNGLQHECGIDLFGKVKCVRAIPIQGTERSKLAVMFAHPDPEVLFFSYEESITGQKQLVVNRTVVLQERGTRPAEFYNDLLVHPSGKIALVHCFMGRIKVIQLKAGDYERECDVALPEFNVLSMTFLPIEGDDSYHLAILHQDALKNLQLITRDLEPGKDDWAISSFPSTVLQPTAINKKLFPFPEDNIPCLIPVPPVPDEEEDEAREFLGGVLVGGGTKILLYELASERKRAKQKGKRERLEKMKADAAKAKSASAKQLERDARRRKPTASVEWPWGEVTAWCGVETDLYYNSRFFIGDSYGNLSLLSTDSVKDIGLLLIPLGVTSSATTIAYLSNQALFLGSHLGDSQLITISQVPSLDEPIPPIPTKIKTVDKMSIGSLSRRKGKQRASEDDMDVDDADQEVGGQGYVVTPDGSYVKVLESFKNIGPIIDAAMVDIDGSGQQQLVTCSGGSNTGSLNVVRNGSEFQELASIPGLVDLTGVWAVKSRFEDRNHSHIAVSTHSESLLYRLDDGGTSTCLTQLSHTGSFRTDERTLAFANVAKRTVIGGKTSYTDSNYVVHVVPSGVYLLEYNAVEDAYNEIERYLPANVEHENVQMKPTEITAASINASQIAVAFDRGFIVVLAFSEHKPDFFPFATRYSPPSPEISAISILPPKSETPFSAQLAASYWLTNQVEIFHITKVSGLGSLVPLHKSEPLPALVRSVQFCAFDGKEAYLVCGMANGSFAHFAWKPATKTLVDKKVVSLGNAPVHLSVCEVDGKRAIFAAGNRATVLALDKQKLSHSPVMLKDITAACRINSETFPDCLLLAGYHGLTIGKVRDLNKLNIRTIPLACANPRRIEYVPSVNAFAVSCNICHPARVGDFRPMESELRLYDAISSSFDLLAQWKAELNEEMSALVAFTRKEGDQDVPYICTGSVVWPEGDKPVTGRIRVFTLVATSGKDGRTELNPVASKEVEGSVYALKWVNDKLVAAVETAIYLYECIPDPSTPSSFTLEGVATWFNIYIPKSLASFNDRIVTGDLVHSVAIIRVKESKFVTEARDYGAMFPVAVEALSEDSLITGTSNLDLFTYSVGERNGKKMLEKDGGYHLADFVTKIIRGSMSSDSANGTPFTSQAVFCTSMGGIGIVFDVNDQNLSLNLSALQRNLAHVAPEAGGGKKKHAGFRAPKTSTCRRETDSSAFGFLDGDFLETFLNIVGEERKVAKVYAGSTDPERLTLPVDDYRRALETLQSMH